MQKGKWVLLLAFLYLSGVYTGVQIQQVTAVVKTPPETTTPTKSAGSDTKGKPKQSAPVTLNPSAKDKPTIAKPATPTPAKSTTQEPAQTTSQASPPVKSAITKPKTNPTAKVVNSVSPAQKVPVPAAGSQGVTIYSLSSSMRADIERLESDVAALKYKISILSNMR